MASTGTEGRASITIQNGTRRSVWVAIYKRSLRCPDEPPIAWQVVSPPPRGEAIVSLPREHQVCARYSFAPENPWWPVHQTHVLAVPQVPAGASFGIDGVSPDRYTWGAVLTRTAERLDWHCLRVVNRFPIGVWWHVRQDGRDVFPPRILPPRASWTEDLSPPFYVAVLPSPRTPGDPLPGSEIAASEVAVRAGENLRAQGGTRQGFKVVRAPARRSRP